MSWNSRVLWSEGLFLRPHHFQQHDRFIESLLDSRCGDLVPYDWGFQALEIDEDLLALGQFAITAARGVLPDGTPFEIPADEAPPVPLVVPENVHQQTIFLGLAVRQSGIAETEGATAAESTTRFFRGEVEVKDTNAGDQSPGSVQVARLRLRLVLEQEERRGFACIGVARVAESQADRRILLDKEFVPPCLDYKVSPYLADFVNELRGLINHRAERLAARIVEPGQGGVAQVSDFMFLQLLNRTEPLVIHLGEMQGLHPESLYRLLLPVAGELATLTSDGRRPPRFAPYYHDDLRATFAPLVTELRRALGVELIERAIAIPLHERPYNFRVAPIADRSLIRQANFVLAVNAKLSPEMIRSRFPSQTKVGPVERIQEFVRLALPGIGLRALPVAPREIPFHAGFTYFELDRSSEHWKELQNSGGFAMHIAGEFPDLELEFWAVRG